MTNDERADHILAKLAPKWREHLGDGHVLDHIVTNLCFKVSAGERLAKIAAYNRKYQRGRRQRAKAASA